MSTRISHSHFLMFDPIWVRKQLSTNKKLAEKTMVFHPIYIASHFSKNELTWQDHAPTNAPKIRSVPNHVVDSCR